MKADNQDQTPRLGCASCGFKFNEECDACQTAKPQSPRGCRECGNVDDHRLTCVLNRSANAKCPVLHSERAAPVDETPCDDYQRANDLADELAATSFLNTVADGDKVTFTWYERSYQITEIPAPRDPDSSERHGFVVQPRGRLLREPDINKCWEVVNMLYCGQPRDAQIHAVETHPETVSPDSPANVEAPPPDEIYLGRWRSGTICEWMPSLRKARPDDEVYVRPDSVWDEAILAVAAACPLADPQSTHPITIDGEACYGCAPFIIALQRLQRRKGEK